MKGELYTVISSGDYRLGLCKAKRFLASAPKYTTLAVRRARGTFETKTRLEQRHMNEPRLKLVTYGLKPRRIRRMSERTKNTRRAHRAVFARLEK